MQCNETKDCECRSCREREVRDKTKQRFWDRKSYKSDHRHYDEEIEESSLFERLLRQEVNHRNQKES